MVTFNAMLEMVLLIKKASHARTTKSLIDQFYHFLYSVIARARTHARTYKPTHGCNSPQYLATTGSISVNNLNSSESKKDDSLHRSIERNAQRKLIALRGVYTWMSTYYHNWSKKTPCLLIQSIVIAFPPSLTTHNSAVLQYSNQTQLYV